MTPKMKIIIPNNEIRHKVNTGPHVKYGLYGLEETGKGKHFSHLSLCTGLEWSYSRGGGMCDEIESRHGCWKWEWNSQVEQCKMSFHWGASLSAGEESCWRSSNRGWSCFLGCQEHFKQELPTTQCRPGRGLNEFHFLTWGVALPWTFSKCLHAILSLWNG